jgi:hypothetical protein
MVNPTPADGRGDGPAKPLVAIEPADDCLHGAEHGSTGEPAEHRGPDVVDVAGHEPSRQPRQREPDEGPEPAGPIA